MTHGEATPHQRPGAPTQSTTLQDRIDEPPVPVESGRHTASRPGEERDHVASWRTHWPVACVLGVFILSVFVIPTSSNVPVGDDWVYTRSVEILIEDGRLEILDLSVVTLVFQIAWGALFSLFDVSFVSTRISTVVLFFLSGIGMYGLCRETGISTHRSALGTAIYLFNPLAFGLAFTFMTDPHFTALLTISMWLYVRGLRPEHVRPSTIVLASVVASLAFLVRQQGALIPFAVGLYLLLAGRWRPDLQGIWMAVRVAGIPAITMIVYYAWLLLVHGAPEQQTEFLSKMIEAGMYDTGLLTARMTYIEIAYIGFFVFPVTLAAIPALRTLGMPATTPARILPALWAAIALAGALMFAAQDRFMPYIAQYVGLQGVGPTDLRGGRPLLISRDYRILITWLVLVSTILFAIFLSARLMRKSAADRSNASLLVMIGLWQVVGILPPSFHFRNWIISVDRYLLPLLPIVIALILWALRDVRIFQPGAWIVVTLFALFSVAGTRDLLVFQEATWDMARSAIERGTPMTALDAGASWDGYHLYEYSVEHGIDQQTPHGPWWTDLFGPATTSDYVVSTAPIEGYNVINRRTYSPWLGDDIQMLLLRRPVPVWWWGS